MMTQPLISVVLPAYNSEQFIASSVQSILNQTFGDFELLVVNDGSSDETANIVRGINDPRVKLVDLEKNQGIVNALNVGIQEAKGEFIARMDADDYSAPARFEKQMAFFAKNPDIGLVGTASLFFEGRSPLFYFLPPADPDIIKAHLLLQFPFLHPAFMMRRSALMTLPRWESGQTYANVKAEDYELIISLCDQVKMSNIQDVLVYRRMHSGEQLSLKPENRVSTANVRRKLLENSGMSFTDEAFKLHEDHYVYNAKPLPSKDTLAEIEAWINQILSHNEQSRYFNQEALHTVLWTRWANLSLSQRNFLQAGMKLTNPRIFKHLLGTKSRLKFLEMKYPSFAY